MLSNMGNMFENCVWQLFGECQLLEPQETAASCQQVNYSPDDISLLHGTVLDVSSLLAVIEQLLN